MSIATLLETLATAALASDSVPAERGAFDDLTDAELLEVTRLSGLLRDSADRTLALAAGAIARRSSPQLGHSGLAQRLGHRTPHELVRATTRSTVRDARSAVRVGAVLDAPEPWLLAVAESVRSGAIPTTSAEAIANGLGEATIDVDHAALTVAADALCHEAAVLDADRLYIRARELRAELDEHLVADHERARRDARSLRVIVQPDGMTRLVWTLDPESAAVVIDLLDRATSPRRGGPRFAAPDATALAASIVADERTTPQLASDVFLQLLRQGSAADSSLLLATGAPSVRVVVRSESLATGSGSARIEGQREPVSIATAQRLACEGATVAIIFDSSGQPLDVGREQRLYTRRQRIALSVRDSGCRWPGCDRPPSWCEAHHITHWARDGGRTDTADGILLCRHHHLLAHNNGWEITRDAADYSLIPPSSVDPTQAALPMPKPSVLGTPLRA